MSFDSDTIKEIAKEQLTDIYAEYKALMSIPPDKRDKKRILEIADEIRELTTKYSITLASVETAAETKSQEIAKKNKDEFEAKKKEEEQKKREEAEKNAHEAAEKNKKEKERIKDLAQLYYAMKDAEIANSGKSFKKALTAQRRTLGETFLDVMSAKEEAARNERNKELQSNFNKSKELYDKKKQEFIKDFGKTPAEMTAIEKAFEAEYERTYRVVGEAKKREADASYLINRRKIKQEHRIIAYQEREKKLINSRNITTALSAAALIGGVLLTTTVSTPILPVLGVVSFIASSGQRKAITGLRSGRLEYYNGILDKQNAKLQKITDKQDKQKKISTNSKQFVRLKRSEARQRTKIANTKHKIAHVTKGNPVKKDIIAAGIQIGASFILATSYGTLAPQFVVGLALYGFTWLAKKAKNLHDDFKKK